MEQITIHTKPRLRLLAVIALVGALAGVVVAADTGRASHPVWDTNGNFAGFCAGLSGYGDGPLWLGPDAFNPTAYNSFYSWWNTNPPRTYTAIREYPMWNVWYSYEVVGGGEHDFRNSIDVVRYTRMALDDPTNWRMEAYRHAGSSC
jgi:hypothetical protein